MPNVGRLAGSRSINGTFGVLQDSDGVVYAEVQAIEATVRIDRRDIKIAGSRNTAYKAMGTSAEGNFRIIKVNSRMEQFITEMFSDPTKLQKQFSLKYTLADPEALGVEEVRLIRVKFWETMLGFAVDQIEERTFPFTFEDIEWIRAITGDATQDAFPTP